MGGEIVNSKELILEHLKYTLQSDSMRPSLATAVKRVMATQARWKPAQQRHSIWQIVRHLINFHQFILDSWDGKPTDLDQFRRSTWQEIVADDSAWETDVWLLLELSRGLMTRAQIADEEALTQPLAGPGWRRPRGLSVLFIGTHAVYHAGQIRYLRALQNV